MQFSKELSAKHGVFMALLASYLKDNDGNYSVRNFTKATGLNPKTISNYLDKLQEAGKIKISGRKIKLRKDINQKKGDTMLERKMFII